MSPSDRVPRFATGGMVSGTLPSTPALCWACKHYIEGTTYVSGEILMHRECAEKLGVPSPHFDEKAK